MRAMIVGLAMVVGGAAASQTTYQGSRPVSVQGIFKDDLCLPSKATGKVVARKFDDGGALLNGVTIEQRNGSRTFINVDLDQLDAANQPEYRAAADALPIILRMGANVSVSTVACGAAGRVEFLTGAAAR